MFFAYHILILKSLEVDARHTTTVSSVSLIPTENSAGVHNEYMALEYLPIMAQASTPKPPRLLAAPSNPSWLPITKPVSGSRVALLSSAALRLRDQEPFLPGEDVSYRLVPSDSKASEIVVDHHSRIGPVPRRNPEIVFPMAALANLVTRGVVGGLSPVHVAFKGGVRQHQEVETKLAPGIARELKQAGVDLALLIPY
jgi:D-proline reductase (dithiol) PrdB